jgi:hypothetical protein
VSIGRTAAVALFALAVTLVLVAAACGGDESNGDETSAAASAQGGEPFTVELAEQNGSGQTGTARFTTAGANRTRVVVEVTNPPAESQPIHIHRGTCEDIDVAPLYGLPNLSDGRTEATVPASIEELATGRLALNAHRSDAQLELYVACGNLPGAAENDTVTDGGGLGY